MTVINMTADMRKALMDSPFQSKKIGKARRFLTMAAEGRNVGKREEKIFKLANLASFKVAESSGQLA